jgi:hypothetical protein
MDFYDDDERGLFVELWVDKGNGDINNEWSDLQHSTT